jgi:hypothetical protein
MTMKDPALEALFRETPSHVPQENCQSDADGLGGESFSRPFDSQLTVSFRVKPDRRSVVTCLYSGLERRSTA